MRIWQAAVAILLFSGAPLSAQQVARVERVLSLRIPEFMIVEPGSVTDEVRPDGTHVRKLTLYVSANRSWRLHVEQVCESECSPAEYRVRGSSGRAARQQEVVVEFVAEERAALPSVDDFVYSLVSG